MAVISILAGSHNDNTKQSLYSSGITTITVPYNVTKISAVCIGGGGGGAGADPGRQQGNQGGGGGALCYGQFNVYPGETLTITVGDAGTGGASTRDGANGGISSITRGTIGSGTLLLQANGGLGGIFRFDPAEGDNPINGGTYSIGVGVTNYGGGNGGSGGTGGGDTDPVVNPNAGGGGGAGGYAGIGGTGGNTNGANGTAGVGGGGGGGAGYSGTGKGYGGGGVGPEGSAFVSGGAGGVNSGGTAGSGSGYNGENGVGGRNGGGGGAASNSATGANLVGSNGYAGVVRLVWGPQRKYPFISAGYPPNINL